MCVFPFAGGIRSAAISITLAAVQAALVTIGVVVVFQLNNPFTGPLATGPDPIVSVASQIAWPARRRVKAVPSAAAALAVAAPLALTGLPGPAVLTLGISGAGAPRAGHSYTYLVSVDDSARAPAWLGAPGPSWPRPAPRSSRPAARARAAPARAAPTAFGPRAGRRRGGRGLRHGQPRVRPARGHAARRHRPAELRLGPAIGLGDAPCPTAGPGRRRDRG